MTKFALSGCHECSHRNRKNMQNLLNPHKSEGNSFLDHVICGGGMWCHRYEPEWKWPSVEPMWIPHWRKSSRCSPQQVTWCALSFGIGKGWSFWISWNPDRPSTVTVMMLTKLKAWTFGVRPKKKTTFLLQHSGHTNLKTEVYIASLGWTVLPHPPYSPDLVPFGFHLFRPGKGELHG